METINRLIQVKQLIQSGLSDKTKVDIKSVIEEEVSRAYLFELLTQREFNVDDFTTLNDAGAFGLEYIQTTSTNVVVNGKTRTFWASWNAIPYLKKAGSFILKNDTDIVVESLRNIVNNYIHHIGFNKEETSFDDVAIGSLVLCLPITDDLLYDRNFSFIRDICFKDYLITIINDISEVFFPRVLESRNRIIALQTIRLIFSYQTNTIGFRSVDSKVESFYLKEFVEKYGDASFKLLGIRLFKQLLDLIESISIEDNYSFSNLYIDTPLADLNTVTIEKLSVIIVEYIIKGINELSEKNTSDLLNLLKFYNGIIYNRLLLYFINKFYSEINIQHFFWNLDNPLNMQEAGDEILEILNQHKSEFSVAQKVVFHEWVEKIDTYHYRNESLLEFETRKDAIKSYWKNCLISDSTKYGKKTQSHPLLKSAETFPNNGSRVGSLDNLALVSILTSREHWGNYNQIALIQDLRNLPVERKYELLENTDAFKFLPEVIYALLTGNDQIPKRNWPSFFKFINQLLKRNELWIEESELLRKDRRQLENDNYNDALIKAIAENIRNAAKKRDESYISKECCLEAISPLINMAEKYKGKFEVLNKDQEYFDAINSVGGAIYDTLIELSITLSVLNNEKQFNHQVSTFIRSKLVEEAPPEELFWIIGRNLVRIGYMDIDWISNNKFLLFENKDSKDLKVLRAYLLYVNTVYKDLYQILYPYYETAIKLFTLKSNFTSKLIQHICIAFTSEWEYSGSIIGELFKTGNSIQLDEMIAHFARANNKKSEIDFQVVEAVKTLWSMILENWNRFEIGEKEQSAFNLIKWAKNFSSITEPEMNLIKKTMDLVRHFPFDYHVMNHFVHISSFNAESIGQLVEIAIDKSIGFDIISYDNLTKIIINLYDQHQIDLADRIVEKLASMKYFFLVDTYISYHNAL